MTPKIKFEVEGWECSRCGHRWVPRVLIETEPTICPKCKSPYWNRPRVATGVRAKRAPRAVRSRG